MLLLSNSNAPSPVADVLEAAAPVAPAPADTYTAPAPVIAHVDPAPALSCAAPAPVNVYVPPVPAATDTALVTATGSLAPETEVASTYAALAIERKRVVWAALEGGHLDIHEANEILADINADALLLEEEQEARQSAKKKAKRNKR